MHYANNTIAINKLAKKIRTLYEAKRSTKTKKYKASVKFDAAWIKIAQVVIDIGADPVLYIESQFMIPDGYANGQYPYPSQLYNELAKSKYKQISSRPQSPFELSFTNQVWYVRDLQKTFSHKTLDEILSDPISPLKSYIRVMLCGSEVLDFILEKYGKEAVKELEWDQGLNEFIKNNYESRYKRIFPERLSTWSSGEYSEDPGPPSEITQRENQAKRRKQQYT